MAVFNKKMFSIAPNGVIFKNNPQGVYAQAEKEIFSKRKMIQSMKKKEKDKNRKNELNTHQNALKIILNSMYGICAVQYSRYFCPMMASAITAVGRQSIKSGIQYTNEILNSDNIELNNILREIENV